MDSPHRFCVAPMMECTDRHYRFLARLLTKRSMLYTEMITTGALLHGDRQHHLEINSCEHPVALQLGGSNPSDMARCSEYATEFNYDEININVGCPSDRVQAGKFGASLMLEPHTVAKCIREMNRATDIEITVKTRIGVDEEDSFESFSKFIDVIAEAGCNTVIVHARKAYLSGLSPKENRTIPPLRYEYVYKIKQEYPQLNIVLNGGLGDIDKIQKHLKEVDGVMIGRKAYEDPYFLAKVDEKIFNKLEIAISRHELLTRYLAYAREQIDRGVPPHILTSHILGLFKGVPGAKVWRRYLSENKHKVEANLNEVSQAAFKLIRAEKLPATN